MECKEGFKQVNKLEQNVYYFFMFTNQSTLLVGKYIGTTIDTDGKAYFHLSKCTYFYPYPFYKQEIHEMVNENECLVFEYAPKYGNLSCYIHPAPPESIPPLPPLSFWQPAMPNLIPNPNLPSSSPSSPFPYQYDIEWNERLENITRCLWDGEEE